MDNERERYARESLQVRTLNQRNSATGNQIAAPAGRNTSANPGQNADPVPPATTTYTSTVSALRSPYRPEDGASNRRRSAVVDRTPRRNGLLYNYAHGPEASPRGLPMRATGQAESTVFQPIINRLFGWIINTEWYICYPAATVMNGGQHNLGWSERTPQLPTKVTGGATNSRMTQRPQYKGVQNIPRASRLPMVYNTKSSPA